MLDMLFPPVRWPRARGPPFFLPLPLCLCPFPLSLPARSARLAASGRSSSSPDDEEDSELRDDSENETRRRLVGGSVSPSNASLRKEEAGEGGRFGEAATIEGCKRSKCDVERKYGLTERREGVR